MTWRPIKAAVNTVLPQHSLKLFPRNPRLYAFSMSTTHMLGMLPRFLENCCRAKIWSVTLRPGQNRTGCPPTFVQLIRGITFQDTWHPLSQKGWRSQRPGKYCIHSCLLSCVRWSPQFTNLLVPLQNTRAFDPYESPKDLLLESRLWAFQVGFLRNLQPSYLSVFWKLALVGSIGGSMLTVLLTSRTSAAVMVFYSPKCPSCVSDVMIVAGFKRTLKYSLYLPRMSFILVFDGSSNFRFFTAENRGGLTEHIVGLTSAISVIPELHVEFRNKR